MSRQQRAKSQGMLARSKVVILSASIILALVIVALYPSTKPRTAGTIANPHEASRNDFSVEMERIARLTDRLSLMTHVEQIAVVRVPDTPQHRAVQSYIRESLREVKSLHVWDDSFTQDTVIGETTFTNIIGTLHPNAERFLVLSAHYDSKLFHNFKFVAAIDSAVPCAILLDIASSLAEWMQSLPSSYGIHFIFFDGEEAFKHWNAQDSIYGSRHLAQHMADSLDSSGKSAIEKISLFVLLDLLGAANPSIPSQFSQTHTEFQHLVKLQKLLHESSLLAGPPTLVRKDLRRTGIQDDRASHSHNLTQVDLLLLIHSDLPWLSHGVPVIHLIPAPFPPQWHAASDTVENLNVNAVVDWATLLRVYTVDHVMRETS